MEARQEHWVCSKYIATSVKTSGDSFLWDEKPKRKNLPEPWKLMHRSANARWKVATKWQNHYFGTGFAELLILNSKIETILETGSSNQVGVSVRD
jgi:hypothetical protein